MKKYVSIIGFAATTVLMSGCASTLHLGGGIYPVRSAACSDTVTSGWGYMTGDPVLPSYSPYGAMPERFFYGGVGMLGY